MKKILTGLLALLLITQSAYAESPSESAAQPVQQEMQQEAQDKADIKTQKPVLKAASYDDDKDQTFVGNDSRCRRIHLVSQGRGRKELSENLYSGERRERLLHRQRTDLRKDLPVQAESLSGKHRRQSLLKGIAD